MQNDPTSDLKERLRHVITGFDTEDLVREDLGEELDFSDSSRLITRVLDLFSRIGESNLDIHADRQINELAKATRRLHKALSNIRNFRVSGLRYPKEERDNRAHELKHAYDEAKSAAGPIIALSFAWKGGDDPDDARQRARDMLEVLGVEVQQVKDELDVRLSDARAIFSEIRDRSGESGIAEYAELFKTAASTYSVEKARWFRLVMWIVGIAGALAVGNSLWVFFEIRKNSFGVGEAIQLGLAKVVVFSFVYYILVAAVRMYRAAAHNEVVNRHRYRAMGAFVRFKEAAFDNATKDAVLLRATESIFGHQSSGLSESSLDASGTSRWMEIVRGLPADQRS